MDPGGGDVTRVLALPPYAYRAPLPSPDSRRVLVFGERVWIIRLATGRRTLLQRSLADASWSPNGKQIVFTSADNHTLLVADADGSRRRVLLRRPYVSAPAWSPDGKRIAYIEQGGTYVVNADGSGRRRLTRFQAFGTNLISWAPDGRRLVFAGSLPESEELDDLLLVRLDGTTMKLATSAAPDLPAWSPDGRRLAFVRFLGPERGPIVGEAFVMDVESGRSRRVTFNRAGESASEPVWSPDGDSLVYARGGGEGMGDLELRELWTVRPDGSGTRPLTRGYPDGGSNEGAAWVRGAVRRVARPRAVVVRRRSGVLELHVPYHVDELAADGPRAAVGPLNQAGPDVVGPKAPIQLWDTSTGRATRLNASACPRVLELAIAGRQVLFDCDQSAVDSVYQSVRLYRPGRLLPSQVFLGRNGFRGAINAGVFVERVLASPAVFAFGTVRSDWRGRSLGRRVWRLRRGTPVAIASGRAVAVAANRIAVERDGQIAVVRADGSSTAVIRDPAARPPQSAFAWWLPRRSALSRTRLLILGRGRLRSYHIRTGRLVRTFALSRVVDALDAADDELAVYTVGGTVHVLRLRDGSDGIVRVPARRLRDLQPHGFSPRRRVRAALTPAGLFLAYNVRAPRPGRVVLIPREALSS